MIEFAIGFVLASVITLYLFSCVVVWVVENLSRAWHNRDGVSFFRVLLNPFKY